MEAPTRRATSLIHEFEQASDLVTIEASSENLNSRYCGVEVAIATPAVKSVGLGEVTVERITTVLNGAQVPELRITGRTGKPEFALAIAQGKEPGGPAAAATVRDEVLELLTK